MANPLIRKLEQIAAERVRVLELHDDLACEGDRPAQINARGQGLAQSHSSQGKARYGL